MANRNLDVLVALAAFGVVAYAILRPPATSTPSGQGSGSTASPSPTPPAQAPAPAAQAPAPSAPPASLPPPSAPAPAAQSFATCTARLWAIGSTGPCVQLIQRLLNQYNQNPNRTGFGQLVVDGIFGPLTQAAVKAFQLNNHLVVDGIVGPQTWGRLLNPRQWQYVGGAASGGSTASNQETLFGIPIGQAGAQGVIVQTPVPPT